MGCSTLIFFLMTLNYFVFVRKTPFFSPSFICLNNKLPLYLTAHSILQDIEVIGYN